MTSESINPHSDPAAETRDVTVSVPEDRVEQFNRFVERFLSAGEHGRRTGRGPRGHRGPGGPRGGRRARHIRRAMYHLAMAEHAPEGGRGRCRSHHGDSVAGESAPEAGPAGTTTV